MNTKSRIVIRVVVLVAIFAWPAVLSYQVYGTRQQMAAAQALERSVQARLETARARHIQMASTPSSTATPGAKP